MKDYKNEFTVDGKTYALVFNLNVMQEIQEKYGTIEEWGNLTDGYVYDDEGKRIPKLDSNGKVMTKIVKNENGENIEVTIYERKETDIKALIFGIKAMLNEAIDIENDNLDVKKPFFNEKQVGRLITSMGTENALQNLSDAVVQSTKSDTPKNE